MQEDFDVAVETLMIPPVVYGKGGNSYGLKWRFGTSEDPHETVGCWFFQMKQEFISRKRSRGLVRFYQLNDDKKQIRECQDESGVVVLNSLNYSEITSVDVHYSNTLEATYVSVLSGKCSWSMIPVQGQGEDIVVRFAAALRHRCGFFGSEMNNERMKALRVAVWIQSLVRMKFAIEKAERMRQRRKGLVSKMLGQLVYADTDSEDEEEKPEQETPTLTNDFIDSLSSNPPLKSSKPIKRRSIFRNSLFRKRNELKRMSSCIQDGIVLPERDSSEIEDELWENERWQFKSGFSGMSLLPTDRSPFSDRLGRKRFHSLSEFDLPEGWVEVQEWSLDLSGQLMAKCGEEGWVYSRNWHPMESQHARGCPNPKGSVLTPVRRRRWFRRRMKLDDSSRVVSPVIWHGWLSRCSSFSGRWNHRYYVITTGLELQGKVTGVTLSFFRHEFEDHLEMTSNLDYSKWNKLGPKVLKSWKLDGAHVLQGTKDPLKFEIRLSTQREPLRFSADTTNDAKVWRNAIIHSLKDQQDRFTLTKSLRLPQFGSFDNIQRYENPILDRLLPIPLDEAYRVLFFDRTFIQELHQRCGYEQVVIGNWSRNMESSSRRVVTFRCPKSKRGPSHNAIEKFKIVKAIPGEGFHVDTSIQSPDSAYGNIYQDEVQIILMNWKGVKTRISVTHQVNLRSIDTDVKSYVQAMARTQTLGYFTQLWLPTIYKYINIKEKRQLQEESMIIKTPTGLLFQNYYRISNF